MAQCVAFEDVPFGSVSGAMVLANIFGRDDSPGCMVRHAVEYCFRPLCMKRGCFARLFAQRRVSASAYSFTRHEQTGVIGVARRRARPRGFDMAAGNASTI
jgi:hypothetical protein